MDEDKIVQKEDAQPTQVSEIRTGENFCEWKPLYDMFGLDESSTHDNALRDIWDYAKKISNLTSSQDIKWQVQKLINEVGSGNPNERSYTKLLNYVHVCNRLDEMKNLKRQMEDNNG